MASLQKKGDSYYCQFCYHGRRHTFTVGAVEELEAENKARQVDYLLMRLKQRLLILPEGTDIVTFVQHDGTSPDTGPTLAAAPRQVITVSLLRDPRQTHFKVLGRWIDDITFLVEIDFP
jgi:hypothetical protein